MERTLASMNEMDSGVLGIDSLHEADLDLVEMDSGPVEMDSCCLEMDSRCFEMDFSFVDVGADLNSDLVESGSGPRQ